jgi:hypothetical protein
MMIWDLREYVGMYMDVIDNGILKEYECNLDDIYI